MLALRSTSAGHSLRLSKGSLSTSGQVGVKPEGLGLQTPVLMLRSAPEQAANWTHTDGLCRMDHCLEDSGLWFQNFPVYEGQPGRAVCVSGVWVCGVGVCGVYVYLWMCSGVCVCVCEWCVCVVWVCVVWVCGCVCVFVCVRGVGVCMVWVCGCVCVFVDVQWCVCVCVCVCEWCVCVVWVCGCVCVLVCVRGVGVCGVGVWVVALNWVISFHCNMNAFDKQR